MQITSFIIHRYIDQFLIFISSNYLSDKVWTAKLLRLSGKCNLIWYCFMTNYKCILINLNKPWSAEL